MATEGPRLEDEYQLGDELGQGAFGVVRKCTSRRTSQEFAVKMISRHEEELAGAAREIDLLRRLAHPCIVPLHDAYWADEFVSMVLGLCPGGAMIEGMQRYWEEKGMLPMPIVQNLSRMMLQSVAWLHQNGVVHCDIKGDNFLMDRVAIQDPKCRILLADFGTALELEPDARLKESCGTKYYWSPERYDRNYGLSVDVWATGVISYGLLFGKFPFKGESETRHVTLKWSAPRATEEAKMFVQALLRKQEAKRATAAEALQLAFLAKGGLPAEEGRLQQRSQVHPEKRLQAPGRGLAKATLDVNESKLEPKLERVELSSPCVKKHCGYAWFRCFARGMSDS